MASYTFNPNSIAIPFIDSYAKSLPILLNSNKQFDSSFKQGDGTSMDIILPSHPDVVEGAVISPSDNVSGTKSLALTQYNVSENMSQIIRSFELQDYDAQIGKPYGQKLASSIQQKAAETVLRNADVQYVYDDSVDFGKTAEAMSSIRDARSFGELYGALSPSLNSKLVASGYTYFQPAGNDFFKKSAIGIFNEAEFFVTPDVRPLITGTLAVEGGATLETSVNAEGTIELVIAVTAGISVGETIKAGQGFTVAGADACDIYGESIGKSYTFVALEDVTADAADAANGYIAIAVKPVYLVNKALKNVDGIIAAGAVVTAIQDSNSRYLTGFVWDKMALAFGSAMLMPISTTESSNFNDPKGITIQVTKGQDTTNGTSIVRWDTLAAFELTRSNWAVALYFKV